MISWWNYNLHDLAEERSADSCARQFDMKGLKRRKIEGGYEYG